MKGVSIFIIGIIALAGVGLSFLVGAKLDRNTAIDKMRTDAAGQGLIELAARIDAVESQRQTQAPSPSQNLGAAGTEIPVVVALFSTSLASQITSSATSMTLVSATDKAGNALASSTYPFIIDEGSASEEMVIADCTSTACTNMIRGIDPVTGTSSVTALKKSHRRGASVKITDGPQLMILSRMANGVGGYPNILKYQSHPTFTSATQIVDKQYVDAGVLAGAATSSESTTGIVRLATALQAASSTATTANTPYVMQAQNATDTPQAGCAAGYSATAGAGCSPIARLTGKLHQSWINLTEAFTWTGLHTFGAGLMAQASSTIASALTITGTTTISASSLTNNAFVINGLAYQWPSVRGATSSVPTEDGTGNLVWAQPDMTLIAASTTGSSQRAATTTFTSTSNNLRVIVYVSGVNSSSNLEMSFNGDSASNYGWTALDNGVVNVNKTYSGGVILSNLATSSASYFTININNPASALKLLSWTGTSATGSNGPLITSGGGVWNNTSAQISSIQLFASGATTLNSGTYMYVYQMNGH